MKFKKKKMQKMSSGFVEKKEEEEENKRNEEVSGWVRGEGGNSKWRGREILAQCYQEWSKLYVCRRMMREAGFMVGTRLPSITPES